MRRVLFALLALVPLAALGLFAPADGQTQEQFSITKVVEGPGPTGGFVIEYSCAGDVNEGGSTPYDLAGPGQPETQSFSVSSFTICTVNETDDNGAASVTYSCSYTPAQGSPADGEGEGFDEGCIDPQTVGIIGNGDTGEITVTNTFEDDVLPDDDEPPAVDDDVVDATPPFTG